MYIGDLKKDTAVTLYVTDGVKAVQLESCVISVSESDNKVCSSVARKLGFKSFVSIKPIIVNNTIVSFSSEKISISMTAIDGRKPYTWKDVQVVKVSLQEYGSIHIILSDIDAKTFNRRNEYRLFLGVDGICKFGNAYEFKNVLIKDISCSGLGMLINKSNGIKPNVGMEVTVQFELIDNDGTSKKYTLRGTVVRYLTTGNNEQLIGCKLIGQNPEIEKMIYERQRKNMTTGNKPQIQKVLTRDLVRDLQALASENTDE